MAHAVSIHPEARVGLAVFTGHVTGSEMVRACLDLVGQPMWTPGYDEVWDLSAAGEVDVNPNELKDLVASAHTYRERLEPNRVAFVTRREAVDILLHLFGLLTADLDRTYRCVESREAAAEWLDVPLPVIDG